MKKFFFLTASLMLCMTAMAQDAAHFTGSIKNFTGGKVMLINYSYEEKSKEITIAADGTFDFIYDGKPASLLIMLDDEHLGSFLYAEPGMKADLQMSIDDVKDEQGKRKVLNVNYSGDNKDCFDYMQKTQGYVLMDATDEWNWDRIDTLSFAEYREGWRETVDRSRHEILNIKSPEFRKMMLQQIEDAYNHYLFRFAWSKAKQDDVFFTWINSLDRNSDMDVASNYMRWYQKANGAKYDRSFAGYTKMLDDVFTNQKIKNMFATEYAQSSMESTSTKDKESLLADYEAYCTDAKAKERVRATYKHYKNIRIGAPLVEFNMEDTKGKNVDMKQFRGKFVYIDCWATWCGPCCAEIPYMEKLYAHYKKNKKLEIISLSLDSNKRKWLDKLANDKPQWKQFLLPGDFGNTLCTTYGINGIPRFMMIDPEGNIISIDAPRPSNPDIINWIEEKLAK